MFLLRSLSLTQLLVLMPLLHAEAIDKTFQLTETDQAFTGTALESSSDGNHIRCALRCVRNEDCIALQVSSESCLLLSQIPTADQLAPTSGTRIYADVLSLPAGDERMPQECPSSWTLIGNACYTADRSQSSSALWQEDSDYCSDTYGPAATLPTFETEDQFKFFADHVSSRAWLNIRFIDGSFKVLGGSTSTFWETKWALGEPDASDDGFVYYYEMKNDLSAVPLHVSPMPRMEVVCMLYAGEL